MKQQNKVRIINYDIKGLLVAAVSNVEHPVYKGYNRVLGFLIINIIWAKSYKSNSVGLHSQRKLSYKDRPLCLNKKEGFNQKKLSNRNKFSHKRQFKMVTYILEFIEGWM